MTEFLTWTAYGPLAAWGNIAVGERRTIDAQPSKSAVVGWLCGALGYRRAQQAEIDKVAAGYDVAFLLEEPGSLLSDYHTTQRPRAGAFGKREVPTTRRDALSRNGHLYTTLSRREYSQDALCFIALCSREEASLPLARLATAIREPIFETYLGRKACPLAWPPNAQIRQANNPADALWAQAADPVLAEVLRKPHRWTGVWGKGGGRLFWEGNWPGMTPDGSLVRRDAAGDRRGWYFSERQEHFWTSEHEATS